MSTPILPLAVWLAGTNQNSIPANDNALRIEALNREIISQAVTAEPASPADGDTYIIASTHTGAQWASFTPDDIVIFKSGTWYAWAPVEGLVVNVSGTQYKYDGGAWVSAGGGGGGAVDSVNGQTGTVILDSDDVSEGSTNLYLTDERVQDIVGAFVVAGTNMTITYNDVSNTLTFAASGGGGGAVSSVNGQTGTVSLALDDLSDVSAASPTTGYFLSWDGSAWVPAAAGGGGGVAGFTASLVTAAPNATINTSALAATGGAGSAQDAAIVPRGNGALLGATPDNATLGGNKRGAYAVDFQLQRAAQSNVASGNYAVLLGGTGNSATATGAVVIGSDSSQATGSYSCVLAAVNSGASGSGSVVTNGASVSADGDYSRAGGRRARTRGILGADVYSSADSSNGEMQRGNYVLNRRTTSGTPVGVLVSDIRSATPSSANQITLADYSVYAFSGIVVGRDVGTATQAWEISGAIKRDAGAGTTSLVGTPTVTSLGSTGTVVGWAVVVTASTSPASLTITVTGASTDIYWTANIQTAEVSLS